MTTRTSECCDCEKPFEWNEDETLDPFERPCAPCSCPECMKIREEERRKERAAYIGQAAERFLAGFMSPRMAQTDRSDSRFNAKLWEKVKAWQPTREKPWLGLIGPTGRCKTRCAYERIADQVRNPEQLPNFYIYKGDKPSPNRREDWMVQAVSAVDFADAVRHQFNADKHIAREALEFITKAQHTKWLLLDDLGKSTHTPAVASALFQLIDYRHEQNKPTIWTANSRPVEFLANMPPDIADPLRGRLIECSTILELK